MGPPVEYRDIPISGISGRYIAGDDGHVYALINRQGRTIPPRPLREWINRNGYRRITPKKPGRVAVSGYVHRFIALAFLPRPDGNAEVNHLSGDKSDNRPSNLEWCDHAENMAHAARHGLMEHGSRRRCARLTEDDVVAIRLASESGELSYRALSSRYGVARTTIGSAVTKTTWRHVKETP